MDSFFFYLKRCVTVFLLLGMFYSQSDGQNAPETTTIRVGYSPSFFLEKHMEDATVAIEVWINSITRVALPGLETEARIYSDITELEAAINAGEVDVAGLLVLEYLDMRDKVALGAGLVGATEDEAQYEAFVLLARREGDAKDLKRFQNKPLVVSVGNLGQVPVVWLNTLLLKSELLEAEQFFSEIKSLDKAFAAIRQVLLGQAALCILPRAAYETAIELNPQLGGDLRVVATSPDFCRGLALFRDDFDERVQVILQESLLALHTEPKGKQIMNFFRIDKLIAFESDYLESVITLKKSYEALKNTK